MKRAELGIGWSSEEIDELLDIICLLGIKHEVWRLWRPLLRDAGDEFIAELAVAAQVGAIITHNVRDFVGMERFGVKVITPGTFLREIGETI